MRPFTAVSKKGQSSSRSIWKKHQSIKPENKNYYTFKTITQILEGTKNLPFNKEDKKQRYYHKAHQSNKLLQQNTLQKQNYHKRTTLQVQKNPPLLKKTMSNNFFSSKQIPKANTDIMSILKIKTQNQIKTQAKFLPYREQSISIIKHSKILSEMQNFTKQEGSDDKMDWTHDETKFVRNKVVSKKRERPSRTEVFSSSGFRKQMEYKENEFLIEQWDNFDEEGSNISSLISNGCRFN